MKIKNYTVWQFLLYDHLCETMHYPKSNNASHCVEVVDIGAPATVQPIHAHNDHEKHKVQSVDGVGCPILR